MLRPRIIPCLLLENNGLVKTVKFNHPKYVGDPINAVKIFNEKEIDELIILDIEATAKMLEPKYKVIENLAAESRMPLCYGGGIKTVEQAQKIISLGIEKIALSSAAVDTPDLITEIAKTIGSQSVVVILDVKKNRENKYEVWTKNGKNNTKRCPIVFSQQLEKLGAGEVVINSINNDGMMQGYDYVLIQQIHSVLSIPMTALGGAGSLHDMAQLIKQHGIIGVAAGSFFVFKGIYRAVLISYPDIQQKNNLINECFLPHM